MRVAPLLITPLLITLGLLGLSCANGVYADDPVSFRSDIAPVLVKKCLPCHGSKKSEGDYRVDNFERAIKVGADEIYARVSSADADLRMPPDSDGLPDEQLSLFKHWLDEGGRFDDTDPTASLTSIVPGVRHKDPPEHYQRSIPITALAFAPAKKQLLVSGYREVTVWDIENSELLRRITNLPERVQCIDIHGNRMVIAGGLPAQLGECRIVDLDSGKVLKTVHRTNDICYSARFSPDGTRLATAGADGTVRIYRVADWREENVFSNHSNWVQCVTWNQEGTKIATASRDHTAKVFDVREQKRLTSYAGHKGTVHCVRFVPNSEDVVSGGADGKLMRWRIHDGATVKEVANQNESVFEIALVDSAKQLVTASGDPFVLAIPWQEMTERRTLPSGKAASLCIAVSSDGSRIATGDRSGIVRIWNSETGESISEFTAIP